MSSVAEIQKMTLPERLEAMEMPWDSLVRDAAAVESPAWHGEVVAARLEKVAKGEGVFLTLEELKRRLARQ